MNVYTGTNVGNAPASLFLLNKQRLDAAYGITDTAALVSKLEELADEPNVNGLIVPVENSQTVSDTYAGWDTGFACDPEAANQVAQAVKNTATEYLDAYPSIEHIVIVGDDLMMPFRRVPDDAEIANEAAYALWSGLQYDNPTRAALEQGYVLSDDFYADRTSLLWRGRELYVPDLSIGRLVETPAEMMAVIDTFIERGGLLAPDTALSSGYDFLIDSAEAISETLGEAGLTLSTLINDEWDKADLQAHWLDTRQDLASINAHFDHQNAIPASGNATLTAGDVLNATATLSGTLNFSMGCHGGYSVHDEHAQESRGLDFAQALAQRGGWWLGNTGFGYGMDDSIAFTERVMHVFAQELTDEPGISVGEALQQAKQRYLGSTPGGGFGTYDEKALIEATLYGLPMYRLSVAANVQQETAPTSLAAMASQQGPANTQAVGLIAKPITVTPSFELVTATFEGGTVGNYYETENGTQASPGRPVQPRTSVELPTFSGMEPHDALFLGGRTRSIDDFNPLISRPVTDTALREPDFDYDGWYPVKTFAVNYLSDPPRLVVIPARYSGDEESGTEKLFEQTKFEVYYAAEGEDDFTAPSIWETKSEVEEGSAQFQVLAQDDTGVRRVVVTYSTDGDQWQSIDLVYSSESGYWEGTYPLDGGALIYFVQVVDKAGNVSMSANKGLLFAPPVYSIYLPLVGQNYSPWMKNAVYLPLVSKD